MFELSKAPILGEYQFIVRIDPALDSSHEDFEHLYERYLEEGDQSILPLRPGQRPTVFKMRHLTGRSLEKVRYMIQQAQRVAGWEGDTVITTELCYAVCQMALRGWEGIKGPDGGEYPIHLVTDDASKIQYVSEDTMTALQSLAGAGNQKHLVYYLGSEALRRISLSPLS